MTRIPVIGVVGWATGPNSFGATNPYLHYLSLFGDIRILTPKRSIDPDLDLVVMPGGKDTTSANYGEAPGYYNSDADQFKEFFFRHNLPLYIKERIPVFGICLGMQQIGIHFGAKLVQDISFTEHETSKHEERSELVNPLKFTREYLKFEASLFRTSKPKQIKVCSHHHQAFVVGDDNYDCHWPKELRVIATSTGDVVEFFEHESLPIAACQCHPEEDYNIVSMTLIEKLLSKSPNAERKVKSEGLALQLAQ
jgi:putative glutamine amidotransferase